MAGSAQSELGIDFNREKFLDAIHFIVASCRGREELLGKTKLHKCLYYADMLHYAALGQPVTGAEYIKQQFGPTARYLEWGLKALRESGRISIHQEEYFGLGKYVFISEEEARSNLLSTDEKALLGEVIAFVCEKTAREISEISHAAPWQNAEMGERIPYSSAHLLLPPTRQASARDVEYAERHVQRRYRA